MNLDVTRGQILYMFWDLPYTEAFSATVYLDLNGAELAFQRGGMIVASFALGPEETEFVLVHTPSGWGLKFVTDSYAWLLDGENTYELTVVNSGGDSIVTSDEGTVTVHG